MIESAGFCPRLKLSGLPSTGIEAQLESLPFPATGSEVLAEVSDSEVESEAGTFTGEDLIPDTEQVTFESARAVGAQIQRPTIATAMKEVLEATGTLPHATFDGSQRTAYEKTFRALRAIDPSDDDEAIQVLSDWVVEQIHEKEKLPGSRALRREAAKYCRQNGYSISSIDWLGV